MSQQLLDEWHRAKRRQGWKCKIHNQEVAEHGPTCPMYPVWYRHPILWKMMKRMK